MLQHAIRRKGLLLTLSSISAVLGIVLLVVSAGAILLHLFAGPDAPASTVPVHLGDSASTIERYLGQPAQQKNEYLFQLSSDGYAHYMVQFTKNGLAYAIERELWPSEQQDQSLLKADCLAMLPPDAKPGTVIPSAVPGYADAQNYTSKTLAGTFKGLTFNADPGNLELIWHYRQVQGTPTIQILACQLGMGKYTGNSFGFS